ncbi:MAG: c-type cytochrome [Chloroflexi bacterium]|nr:c-type cytochrome [Chloroflexota bacterium]MBV9132989.1 c-type cytochrome [Chloroflexota bacterium]
MASEPEAPPGALAPRSSSALAPESPRTLTGGAGLFDHSRGDALSPTAGAIAGVLGLIVTAGIAILLVSMNPSFASGKAGGTANQLGAAAAAGGAPVVEPGSPAADGQQIIAGKPCVGCHTIPGIPGANGTVGPNLAGVASRTKIAGGAVNNSGPDDLKAWILNPPAKKPGTLMPNLGLTDDEATKIVAYLELLK